MFKFSLWAAKVRIFFGLRKLFASFLFFLIKMLTLASPKIGCISKISKFSEFFPLSFARRYSR